MAVFIHVAAGTALVATGDAAEMMRASPAYREITGDDAQGRKSAVATAPVASVEPGTVESMQKTKNASKRKKTASPKA